MQTRTRLGVAAALSVAGLAIAPAAMANNVSGGIGGSGSYSYSDVKDRFCVTGASSNPGRGIGVTLTALNKAGPTKRTSSYGGAGTKCVSLKYAYEDTYYKAVLRGPTGTRTVKFYS